MPNALKGSDFVYNHPELRAKEDVYKRQHTHCTTGLGMLTLPKAVEAGVYCRKMSGIGYAYRPVSYTHL